MHAKVEILGYLFAYENSSYSQQIVIGVTHGFVTGRRDRQHYAGITPPCNSMS